MTTLEYLEYIRNNVKDFNIYAYNDGYNEGAWTCSFELNPNQSKGKYQWREQNSDFAVLIKLAYDELVTITEAVPILAQPQLEQL